MASLYKLYLRVKQFFTKKDFYAELLNEKYDTKEVVDNSMDWIFYEGLTVVKIKRSSDYYRVAYHDPIKNEVIYGN